MEPFFQIFIFPFCNSLIYLTILCALLYSQGYVSCILLCILQLHFCCIMFFINYLLLLFTIAIKLSIFSQIYNVWRSEEWGWKSLISNMEHYDAWKLLQVVYSDYHSNWCGVMPPFTPELITYITQFLQTLFISSSAVEWLVCLALPIVSSDWWGEPSTKLNYQDFDRLHILKPEGLFLSIQNLNLFQILRFIHSSNFCI